MLDTGTVVANEMAIGLNCPLMKPVKKRDDNAIKEECNANHPYLDRLDVESCLGAVPMRSR